MGHLNGVFIIPTGLNCSLGGDAAFNPGVKLISNCAKNLIVNPNAVNASDINELPNNALYVEGSTIDRFLEGKINLKKIKKYNRILMAINPPITPSNLNSLNAGIWGLGADITSLVLDVPITMNALINSDGTAGGTFAGVKELVKQVKSLDFDALALQTPIDCSEEVSQNYWENGGVNPWGGIEAIVSKEIANKINKPIAHAPSEPVEYDRLFNKIIVKRSMSPEIISNTYTFCILKGLHRSPSIELDLKKVGKETITNKDIDFLISPHGCWGRPHQACIKANIPIIIVKENTTCFSDGFKYPKVDGLIFVNNYLEAAGVIMSMDSGVDYRTIIL